MPGLFSTLNVSIRGMAAQQQAINVTSHNIANANTDGYSRQRALIETSNPTSMSGFNNAVGPGQIGTGAQVTAIQRYRDAFLDYQTRVETSTKGQFDVRQTALGEVESIFNEPSDTGLSTVIGKFFDSWQQLSKQPESSNSRTVVAQQSSALADDLNHTYAKLMDLKTNMAAEMKNSVVDVNTMLKQIDTLNQQIVDVSVGGSKANDLMDKRDALLDQLSKKINITVEAKNFDGINIKPVDSNGMTDSYMIKSQNVGGGARLSYITAIDKDNPSDPTDENYTITYYKNGDTTSDANKMTLKVSGIDAQALKSLQEGRILWTDNSGTAVDSSGNAFADGASVDISDLKIFQPSDGEIKGYATVQQDIDGYIDQLNKVAKALAFSVNAIHSGMTDPLNVNPNTTAPDPPHANTVPSIDSMPFFVNKDVAQYDANNTLTNLGDSTGGVLFSEKDITAGNISINQAILNNPMNIKTRTNDDKFDLESSNDIDGETDGTRAQAIAQLRDKLMSIQNIGININDRKDMFDTSLGGNQLTNNSMDIINSSNGMTIDSYFKDTIDKLGISAQEANRMVTNQQALLSNFDESRTSISGVSLDEETANLIQFQHAYQANAKVISTIDQLLDVVVNGLIK